MSKNEWGYGYADSYDAIVAAPEVHRLRYEDVHIQFLEVSNPPGYRMQMHGHPYPSVFARVSDLPPLDPNVLDPNSPLNGQNWSRGPAPEGMVFPKCTSADPQAPHMPLNRGAFPLHFFRIEFKRLDDERIQQHWKEWYQWMLAAQKPLKDPVRPASGPNFSKEWPYPIVYDSVNASPNNYRVLYENNYVRLVEVGIRPRETEGMHGHPYASVLAFDSRLAFDAVVNHKGASDKKLDPSSPLNGENAGQCRPPKGMLVPRCLTMGPQAIHAMTNEGDTPIHFYRIEFKRVDGDGIKTNWRKWYPWMLTMK